MDTIFDAKLNYKCNHLIGGAPWSRLWTTQADFLTWQSMSGEDADTVPGQVQLQAGAGSDWAFASYVVNNATPAAPVSLANDGVDALYTIYGTSTIFQKFSFDDTLVWTAPVPPEFGAADMCVQGDYIYVLTGSAIDRYSAIDGTFYDTFFSCIGYGTSFAFTGSNWFVGDIMTNRIYKLDLAGSIVTSWVHNGVEVVRTDGSYLYVGDYNDNLLKKVELDGTPVTSWDVGEYLVSCRVAVGLDGNIYHLLEAGDTVRVYSNVGVLVEDIPVELVYVLAKALTVTANRFWISSGYAPS